MPPSLFKFKNIITAKPSPGFFVPEQLVIHGDINATVPGRIEGVVDGNITVNGKLIVGREASLTGNIQSDEIMVYGKVTGNITCMNKVWIGESAYVEGLIHGEVVEISEGAVVKQENLKPAPVREAVFQEDEIRAIVSPAKIRDSETTWF